MQKYIIFMFRPSTKLYISAFAWEKYTSDPLKTLEKWEIGYNLPSLFLWKTVLEQPNFLAESLTMMNCFVKSGNATAKCWISKFFESCQLFSCSGPHLKIAFSLQLAYIGLKIFAKFGIIVDHIANIPVYFLHCFFVFGAPMRLISRNFAPSGESNFFSKSKMYPNNLMDLLWHRFCLL